ncbi:pto-interacting protein 1-like [Dorcoceras hygrometricum]|uniref:Pto-interacting protein 1-like n=1 Tax=Dorcoceras hygrometricum TaxID=472368 RepID=A0A2Z7DGZ2_9LAMI|nr:pto-interacting protein 1-like [Dorcoceras hygrometricum]
MFLVDWAVKMRIRPPEFETSICDAKYHVSLSTRSVLGKCVYLATLAMSLFDLQDVCIAIGSIATLDLPMVVDLIGIYGLKGPYSATRLRRKIVSGQFDEENPFVLISSVLLVQADEGVSFLVMDRIGDIYRNLPRRADVIVTTIGNSKFWNRGCRPPPPAAAHPPRAIVRARQHDDRAMNAHVALPGETMCANCCATPPLEARCLAPPWATAGGRLTRFCCTPLRRSTPLVCCLTRFCCTIGARRRWSAALVAAACAPCGARDFVDGGRRTGVYPAMS